VQRLRPYAIYIVSLVNLAPACAGPKLTTCISDPAHEVLLCQDHKGRDFEIPLVDSDGFICHAPDDYKQLLDWCKAKQDE